MLYTKCGRTCPHCSEEKQSIMQGGMQVIMGYQEIAHWGSSQLVHDINEARGCKRKEIFRLI